MFMFHPMALMLNDLGFALLVLNFKNKLKGRVGYVSIHSWGTFEVQSDTIGESQFGAQSWQFLCISYHFLCDYEKHNRGTILGTINSLLNAINFNSS